MIKYSVVIPMYNNKDTIIKAIKSVEKQSRYDLIDEIIVVNDGSKDDSLEVVEQYIKSQRQTKVKIISKLNGGAASARNVGIRATSNNYVALLDADDVWLPNKMEVQNRVFEINSKIRALGSNRIGEVIFKGSKIDEDLYHLSPLQYCVKNWPCTPSLVFDKTIFEDEHYFDESMTHAEEGIFFLDLSAKSGLYYCAEPLVVCGDGKPVFGHSGLSGNIKKMHLGVVKMMRLAEQKKYITKGELFWLNLYEQIKYVRRIVLVKMRKR